MVAVAAAVAAAAVAAAVVIIVMIALSRNNDTNAYFPDVAEVLPPPSDPGASRSEFETLANDVFASNPRVAEQENLASSTTGNAASIILFSA